MVSRIGLTFIAPKRLNDKNLHTDRSDIEK